MHVSSVLLRRAAVYAKRLRYSQWWKVCHFPNQRLRRYGVLESMKYQKIIHDLDYRFGFIGEAPHVQIGAEGAFIFMRHFVQREKALAIESFCGEQLSDGAEATTHIKPTLLEKIRFMEEQADALARLNPCGVEVVKTEDELAAEQKEEQQHREAVLERLKALASDPEMREHVPAAEHMAAARKWQRFYKEPLYPLVPEGAAKDPDPFAVHF
eukprot:EG_transcript_23941